MNITKAASRFAKAWMEFAIEKNMLEETHNDVLTISKAIDDSRDFELFLLSKVIQENKKAPIMASIFEGKVGATTLEFLKLVAIRSRSAIIPGILKSFELQYRIHKRILTVDVTTAVPMDEALRTRINDVVTKMGFSGVDIVEQVDEEIIGGIILRLGDQQFNASVAHRLNEINNELKNAAVSN